MNTKSTMLPRVVYQMSVNGALIVGSYAKFLCGEKDIEPNDFDLIVPIEKWQIIALLIPKNAKPNKFGGWRFMVKEYNGDEMVEVDVWPGSLYDYLATCKTKYGGSVCAVDFINNRVFKSEFLKGEQNV